MTLNISATQSAGVPESSSKAPSSDRRLVNEVIDELSSWGPRDFIATFRRWHHDAFSLIHLNVLTLLEAHGPMPMSHIAEALDISVASATGVIDRMEARGLVERSRDADDRRVVLVHGTTGGADVFREIDARRRKALARLLEQLSDDELGGLLRGHRAMRRARMSLAAAQDGVTDPARTSAGGSAG